MVSRTVVAFGGEGKGGTVGRMVDLDSTLSSGVRHTWKTLFSVGDTLLIKTQFVRRLPSQHNPRCWEIFFTALIRSGGLGRAEYRGSSKQTVAKSVKMPEQISRISVEGPAVAANGIAHQNVNSEPDKQATVKGPVCVTGAAGYVGSWLIMRLLEQGYTVRATVRDPGIPIKTKHLLDLPEADKRLTLWKADLDEEGSFDAAIDGCEGVFHVATPMDFESQDPENEVIKPCINGVLNVMRSCAKAKSVKRVVFTSSAGTVDLTEHQYPGQVFDETNWSDVQFCRRLKMTGWMYFVSKTLAEKAAWEFAEEKKLDLITIIPTLVVGPFIMQTMPPSMITALSLITRNESHYHIIKNAHLVHLDDLCIAHIFLYEHPQAKGRYICSSESTTIIEVAKMLARKYPEYNVPTEFEDVDEKVQPVQFSSKKLIGLGFEFKYTVEDMFDGAIQSCRERKLL